MSDLVMERAGDIGISIGKLGCPSGREGERIGRALDHIANPDIHRKTKPGCSKRRLKISKTIFNL
jgi:hypothetical protein